MGYVTSATTRPGGYEGRKDSSMTINERLALMDEIARKNNAEWDKYKRNPRSNRHKGEKPPHSFHPFTEWVLECLFTFCAVILMGAVALIS